MGTMRGPAVRRVGPGGNANWLEALEALLEGETVAAGAHSGDTGYSGYWDEYRLDADRRVVEAWGPYTDTSHDTEPELIYAEPVLHFVLGKLWIIADDIETAVDAGVITDEQAAELSSRAMRVLARASRIARGG